MRFRAKISAIWEEIALLRANQIARITSDSKMDAINIKKNQRSQDSDVSMRLSR